MRKSRFSEEQIIHCPAVHCEAMSREGASLRSTMPG